MKKSISYLSAIFEKNKTLAIALVISLLVHLLVLSQYTINSAAPQSAQRTFEVELSSVNKTQLAATETKSSPQSEAPAKNTPPEPLQPTPAALNLAKAAETKSEKAVKQATELPKEQAKPVEPSEVAEIKPIIKPTPESIAEAKPKPEPIAPPTPESVAEAKPEPVKQAMPEPIVPKSEPQFTENAPQPSAVDMQASNTSQATSPPSNQNSGLLPSPAKQASGDSAGTKSYKNIETDFEVYQSTDPSMISINKVAFNTRGKKDINQTYALTQSLNTVSSTTPSLSEGIISRTGLKPNYYAANGKSANFAWSDGVIEHNHQFEKLKKGTQDEMSYIYQFMFSPPTDITEVVFSDGTQFITYRFNKLGEEVLPTKMGEINTVHLLKDGDEKIDLWLAVDYQYIPIKIRQTAKDGTFTEQIAVRLATTLADDQAP
ncbi:MAG: DUF3108 domain-containing protein [Methylophilaceae bacterium]